MLASARNQYRQQQRIGALGVAATRRAASRGARAVAQSVAVYQSAAVALSLQSTPDVLAEQGIPDAATGQVVAASLLTGIPQVASLLPKVETPRALDRLVLSLIQDAGRTATVVDMATRTAVTGYVRVLVGSSCSRCAILAGRVYRYSEGFLRHPNDDCTMAPTTEAAGRDQTTDPVEAFRAGRVHGLSRADAEAVNAGADFGQVVNVRRKAAGLTVGSSVVQRAGRLTPQGCLSLASDRDEALRLLRLHGYLTTT